MFGHPGKKLLFMGCEFGQWREWNHDQSLDWHLLEHAPHRGIQSWVRDLNQLYRREPALHARDFDRQGFEWADLHDWEHSIISFFRRGEGPDDLMLVVCNFTPVTHANYRLGVPRGGFWREALNSDSAIYGGSGQGNLGGVEAAPVPAHGRYHSLSLTLPPLGILYLKAPPTPVG
jgi:1,4-alpha-glucan branching enzyme